MQKDYGGPNLNGYKAMLKALKSKKRKTQDNKILIKELEAYIDSQEQKSEEIVIKKELVAHGFFNSKKSWDYEIKVKKQEFFLAKCNNNNWQLSDLEYNITVYSKSAKSCIEFMKEVNKIDKKHFNKLLKALRDGVYNLKEAKAILSKCKGGK